MTTDVLRLQGDYLIRTQTNSDGQSTGGTILFDLGSDASSTGTVIIKGNLDVKGTTTQFESINVTTTATVLLLNSGDIGVNGGYGVSNTGVSGIQIARGKTGNIDDPVNSAYIEWNENASWSGGVPLSGIPGEFEFRVGTANGSPLYSAIKVNAIRMPVEGGADGAYSIIGGKPRLNIFGTDNPNSVLSVHGTSNYAANVTDDDDIPNKYYVDHAIAVGIFNAESVVDGKSFIKIIDNYKDSLTSEIIGVLDGNPAEKFTITTGTVVMRITANVAQFSGVEFVGNQIQSVGANIDLKLAANGMGQIIVAAPLIFESNQTPQPGSGQTGLYTDNPGGGGTGIYYVNSSTLGAVTSDEFVSRKKALVFSLIF
jgi:hypothetical protein